MEEFKRRDLLLTDKQIEKIASVKIAIFGLGGVGGYVVEALSRMGVENFILCDGDIISLSNINRQILSLHSNIGRKKTDVAKERITDINPSAYVDNRSYYFKSETCPSFPFDMDYIADCIDSVNDKILLVDEANKRGIPIISSMGTGNRLFASFKIADIKETNTDPIAKIMRKELKKLGIENLKVLFSDQKPLNPYINSNTKEKRTPGSLSYVVGIAGLMMAEEIIKDILKSCDIIENVCTHS